MTSVSLAAAVASVASLHPALGVTHVLTGGSTSWNTPGNWTNGVPNAAGDIATLGGPTVTATNLDTGSTITIGQITNAATAAWTLTPTTTTGLIFNNSGGANNNFGNSNSAIVAVGTGGNITIAASVPISIGATNLDIGGTNSGIVTIGSAITASATSVITFHANATGAMTLNGNVGASGSNISISNVGTGGGGASITGSLGSAVTSVTQNGTSPLTLSGSNGLFSGSVTVQSGTLTGTSTTNTINAFGTGLITLSGGTLAALSNGTGNTQTIVVGNNVAVTATSTMSVGRVSANSGSTEQFGNLTIGASTLNVTGAGGSYTLQFTGTTSVTGAAVFNPTTNGTALSLGAVTIDGSVGTGTTTVVTLDGANTGHSVTGVISNNALDATKVLSLNKTNSSTWTLTGANTYTGATTIGVAGSSANGGTLIVSGVNGTINGSSGVTMSGGKLTLDNTAGNVNRIRDGANVSMSLLSELNLTGFVTSDTTETIGTLTLGTGNTTITVVSATNRVTTLATTALTRSGNGTALLRGSALDQSQATNVARITGAAPTGANFVGTSTLAGGATNDATQSLKIVPWMIGDTSAAGNGKSFVTYDSTLGYRVLNTTEYTTLVPGSTTAANPINALGAGVVLTTSALTINSLDFQTGALTLNGTNTTLTINSGAIIAGATTDVLGSGLSSVVLGNGEGIIQVGSSGGTIFTVNTALDVTSGGGLTKGGVGTLQLTGANLYTGATIINQGTLQIGTGGAGNLASGSAAVTVNSGATLLLNQANNSTFANDIVQNGTLSITNAGTETLSGSISGTGGLTQATAGTNLILSGASSTFSGASTISAGTVTVASNNALGLGAVTLQTTGTIVASGGARTLGNNLILNSGLGTPGIISGSNNITLNGVLTTNTSNTALVVQNPTTTFAGGINVRPDAAAGRTLFLSGTGNIVVSGVVADGLPGATGGILLYEGSGLLSLTGANTFTGSLGPVGGASVLVDYVNAASGTSTNYALNSAVGLNLQGGTLEIRGKAGGGNTTNQTVGAITGATNSGLTTVVVNRNTGTATTLTGTISSGTNSAVLFDLTQGGSVVSTAAATSGLVNNGQVLIKDSAGRIDFATDSGANTAISSLNASLALTSGVSVNTVNYKLIGNLTLGADTTARSIRIDSGSGALTLDLNTKNLIFAGQGLLVVGANDVNITGTSGALTGSVSTASNTTIEQFATGKLTITAKVGFSNGSVEFVGNGSNSLIDWNSSSNLTPTSATNGRLAVTNTTLRLTNSGAISLTNAGALAIGTGIVDIASGGIIELTSTDLTRDLGSTANGQLNFAGSGGFSAFGAARNVTLSSGAALTWGTTTGFIAEGETLILGSNFSTNTVTLTNNIALGATNRVVEARDGANAGVNGAAIDGVLSGVISGVGSLFKTGAGTLGLSNTNTYTGATQILAGRLNISTGGTINTSSGVTINGGELAYNSSTAMTAPITFTAGTLSGTTTVSAVAATNASDIVAPGSSSTPNTYGKLTVAGNFSLNGGGTLAIDLSKSAPTLSGGTVGAGGGTFDQVAVTSTATSVDVTGGNLALTLSSNVEQGDVYLILDNQTGSTPIAGTFTSATINGLSTTFASSTDFYTGMQGVAGSYEFTINYAAGTGNDISLSVVAAPEPTSLALLGLGSLGLLSRRRRRAMVS